MLDRPLQYTGPDGMTAGASELDAIRIGLYAPGDPQSRVVQSMIRGASIAIDEANRAGGYQGKPFRILCPHVDDPWSGGSKIMTDLVYHGRVWAVVGASSSESTHIAEQVCTKTRVPLLSPVSSDPSLTHIRIPWIFRLPPDMQAQAKSLVSDIFHTDPSMQVGLLTSTDLDGRLSAEELKKALEAQHHPPLFHFTVDPASIDIEEIVIRIQSFRPDGLVLRLPVERTIELVQTLNRQSGHPDIFLPWIPGLDGESLRQQYAGQLIYVLPYAQKKACGPQLKFIQSYIHRFAQRPSPSAVFTYDAVTLIVNGIRTAGLSRAGLRNAIAALDGYQGAAGSYAWDNGGGNTLQPFVYRFGYPSR